MAKHGSLLGLFLLRTDGPPPEGGPVLARIEGELYALAFSDAPHAGAARQRLELEVARPFYVCAANADQVVRELRAAGACGFIVDYDPTSSTFSSAGVIPCAA